MNARRIAAVAMVAITVAACRHHAAVVTRPLAPAACKQAHIVATNTASLQPFVACHEIASLTARSGAEIDFSVLANLVTVHGDVRIGPSVAISEIALPTVQAIEGTLRVASNTALTGVFVSRLQRVGAMEFSDNAALATISLARLQSVAGDVTVQRNGDLSTVLAPGLTHVTGRFRLAASRSLEVVEFAKQFAAGVIEMEGLPKLDWTMVPGAPAKPEPANPSTLETPSGDPAF